MPNNKQESVAEEVILMTSTMNNEVSVINAQLLIKGEFFQSGNDLIIENNVNEPFIIKGYFLGEAKVLTAPNGSALTFDIVKSLLQPIVVESKQVVVSEHLVNAEQLELSIGHIDEIDGKVTAKTIDGIIRQLEQGDLVFQGEIIQASSMGRGTILFKDNSSLKIANHAKLILDKYVYDPSEAEGELEATILQGIFQFESGDIANQHAGRHTTFKTPVAVIGVRGSEIFFKISDTGETTVIHNEGVIDIMDVFQMHVLTLLEPGSATAVLFKGGMPQPIFDAPEALMLELREGLGIEHRVDFYQENISNELAAQSDILTPESMGESSVYANHIDANYLVSDNVYADTINADTINADTINADTINADTINSDTINADTINANIINANTVNADFINADVINADTIIVDELPDNINADNIIENDNLVEDVLVSARAVDGFLLGATAFLDVNSNGKFDNEEPFDITRTELTATADEPIGFFSIDALVQDGQQIIVTGGIDSSTGQVFIGELKAAAGSNYVSPLTSLIQSLIDQGIPEIEAKQQVNIALGLDEATDLGSVNPITNATILQPNVIVAQVIKEVIDVLGALSQSTAKNNTLTLTQSEQISLYKLITEEVATEIASNGAVLTDSTQLLSTIGHIIDNSVVKIQSEGEQLGFSTAFISDLQSIDGKNVASLTSELIVNKVSVIGEVISNQAADINAAITEADVLAVLNRQEGSFSKIQEQDNFNIIDVVQNIQNKGLLDKGLDSTTELTNLSNKLNSRIIDSNVDTSLTDLQTIINETVAPVNVANKLPILENSILDQVATETIGFSFQVQENTFSDPDILDNLIYSASLSDGNSLPE